MRILAIDSSGLVATVAVVEEENKISKTIAEYTINYKKTHSQTLLPMLDEIVKMTDMNLDTIDAIAVAGGPGSFTGLRIGSATAKGLGLALKKPLIHIPTVDGLAYNLCIQTGSFVRSWMQEEIRYILVFIRWTVINCRFWKHRWQSKSMNLPKNFVLMENQ